MFTGNDISVANHEIMRVEISPGKMGEGLFPPGMMSMAQEEEPLNKSDDGLSSEEETLIAQSTFELQKIIAESSRPGLLSRF